MSPVDGLTFTSIALFTPGISPAGFYWSGKPAARLPTGKGSQPLLRTSKSSPQIVSFTESLRDTSVSYTTYVLRPIAGFCALFSICGGLIGKAVADDNHEKGRLTAVVVIGGLLLLGLTLSAILLFH